MRTRASLDGWICGGIALLTVLVHLHVNTDITNDHAAYIAMARQMLYGDWPIRDFRDDGSLLQLLLSAAVQMIGGFRLLGELLLAWVFIAAANGLTYWLAFRLSGSRLAAAVAAVLTVLLVPRPYAYPKLFVYPLAFVALSRYAGRPDGTRLAMVAAATALAFLFRIDHGVVVGAAALVSVFVVRAPDVRAGSREGLRLAGWCVLFGLPQMAYVTWATGWPRYVESILSFGTYAVVTGRGWPLAPSLTGGVFSSANGLAFLLNLYLLIAIIALIHTATDLTRSWRRGGAPPAHAVSVVTTLVMWGLMVPMLARDQLDSRVAEIGVPIAILGAWIAQRWRDAPLPRVVRMSVLGTILAASLASLCARPPMTEFFTRPAAVFRDAPFQIDRFETLAESPPIERYAPPSIEGERWAVRYAALCTRENDRLLVTWFGPEVYLYAGRAFAGDRWVYLPFDNSRQRQRAVVERLRAQSVPLVFVDIAEYAAFGTAWPEIAAYLDQAYASAAEVRVPGARPTRVLARRDRIPSRHVGFANLPCFK